LAQAVIREELMFAKKLSRAGSCQEQELQKEIKRLHAIAAYLAVELPDETEMNG
jgi:hypothetical protein